MPHFLDSRLSDDGKIVSLTHRQCSNPLLPQETILLGVLGTNFIIIVVVVIITHHVTLFTSCICYLNIVSSMLTLWVQTFIFHTDAIYDLTCKNYIMVAGFTYPAQMICVISPSNRKINVYFMLPFLRGFTIICHTRRNANGDIT
jgi:hypothetical protein